MRLFDLIKEATEGSNINAAWQIIQEFDPLINNESRKFLSSEIDEDLKSEIQLILVKRIRNFKIIMGDTD